ncbi:MAG: hypothetical protein P8L85_24650 [Rubripirellula sp.]|nr:hypothetical protein [Rubripirellula sp.]
MWIGSRLYQDGRISAEQFADAICQLTSKRKKLGQIAMEKRFLSVKQVMDILAEQARNPSAKFGELAISLGLLNDNDVAELLGHQTQDAPSLSSILLELGYISPEDLQALFDANASEIKRSPVTFLASATQSIVIAQ